MKNLILLIAIIASSATLFAQATDFEVYLKPIKITYHANEQSSGMSGVNDIRYSIKVNGGARVGCFGYRGSMHENASSSSNFENLNSSGEMPLGKFKKDETIDIRFDGWVNTAGYSWDYESGDLEKSDASSSVKLNGKETVTKTFKGSHFEITFEVYQKEGGGGRTLIFGM